MKLLNIIFYINIIYNTYYTLIFFSPDSTYLKQLLEAFYVNEAQEIAVQPPSEMNLPEVDGNG